MSGRGCCVSSHGVLKGVEYLCFGILRHYCDWHMRFPDTVQFLEIYLVCHRLFTIWKNPWVDPWDWPKLRRMSGTQPGTLEFGPGYQFQQDSHVKTRQNSKYVACTGCENCKSGTRVLPVGGIRAPNDPPALVRHKPETGQDWASSCKPLSLETYNIHVCIVVRAYAFIFLGYFYLGVELPCHMVTLRLIWRGSRLFSKAAGPLCVSSSRV